MLTVPDRRRSPARKKRRTRSATTHKPQQTAEGAERRANWKIPKREAKNRGTRTQPLAGGDAEVLVPLTVLDAILGDETTLKRDELRVRALDALGGRDELTNRRRDGVFENLAQDALHPTREVSVRTHTALAVRLAAGKLVEKLPELELGVDLLGVKCHAGSLKAADRPAETSEIGVHAEGSANSLDPGIST